MWFYIFVIGIICAIIGGRKWRRQIQFHYNQYSMKFRRIAKRPTTPPISESEPSIVIETCEQNHTVIYDLFLFFIKKF